MTLRRRKEGKQVDGLSILPSDEITLASYSPMVHLMIKVAQHDASADKMRSGRC